MASKQQKSVAELAKEFWREVLAAQSKRSEERPPVPYAITGPRGNLKRAKELAAEHDWKMRKRERDGYDHVTRRYFSSEYERREYYKRHNINVVQMSGADLDYEAKKLGSPLERAQKKLTESAEQVVMSEARRYGLPAQTGPNAEKKAEQAIKRLGLDKKLKKGRT